MDKFENHLIVVGGPTAVGKTTFSISLAKHYGTEIISADSRQVYQGLTIGTAKPTKEELAEVRHHFIDILKPEQEYNAGLFEKDALKLLGFLFDKFRQVVVCGGSGMYVQALCNGIDDIPNVPSPIRRELNQRLETEGLANLLLDLEHKDPAYFKQVDTKNPQRVVRALEVITYTNKPFSSFRTGNLTKRPFGITKIGLERPREDLYNRIENRMEQMILEGLFEEAKSLYPFKDLNALQTVGYKEVFGYFEGDYGKEEAIRLLKRNSRRYAKRQLTWFKKDREFEWFHPDKIDDAISFIDSQMKR